MTREEISDVLEALDKLALILSVDYGHTWGDEEKGLYERAVNIVEGHLSEG